MCIKMTLQISCEFGNVYVTISLVFIMSPPSAYMHNLKSYGSADLKKAVDVIHTLFMKVVSFMFK